MKTYIGNVLIYQFVYLRTSPGLCIADIMWFEVVLAYLEGNGSEETGISVSYVMYGKCPRLIISLFHSSLWVERF